MLSFGRIDAAEPTRIPEPDGAAFPLQQVVRAWGTGLPWNQNNKAKVFFAAAVVADPTNGAPSFNRAARNAGGV